MKKNKATLALVILCYAAAAGVWYWYLTSRPLTEGDFSTFTGTLKSAEEKGSRKSVYLEFYIVERPFRFRVPVDGYRELFNRQAFFANVRPGAKIDITVEKAQLDKPNRPLLDPIDTVFVHGLKDERMTYCTLGGRKDWEEKNRLYGLIMAIALSIAAVGLTVAYARLSPETSGSEPPTAESSGYQAEVDLERERLARGTYASVTEAIKDLLKKKSDG
jgi:hypothetical protein